MSKRSGPARGLIQSMDVTFYTLGCKVNQYETQAMIAQFKNAGFTVVEPGQPAQVLVVNSCTVTATGDKKSRNRLARFRRENPHGLVVLTGCYPQAFPDKAAGSGADIITGTANKGQIVELVLDELARRGVGAGSSALPVLPTDEPVHSTIAITPYTGHDRFEPMQVKRFEGKTRAFVKVQDGCDRFCSYCIIPVARGRVRSKALSDINSELAALAQNGYREVVLVGINLPCYGKDTGRRLVDALETACAVDGIERVRLGSLEPELLTDEDLRRMAAQPKFCPQFHLSLQSGCDNTLRRMNRHYTAAEYADIVRRIRAQFPGAAITTDVIVGFPGETEEDFLTTLAFVQKIAFSRVHVFTYSRREGTRAAAMPDQIPKKVKEERGARLTAAVGTLHRQFCAQQVGSTQSVLLERQVDPDTFEGYTKNYTQVLVTGSGLAAGQIREVLITGISGDYCTGQAR